MRPSLRPTREQQLAKVAVRLRKTRKLLATTKIYTTKALCFIQCENTYNSLEYVGIGGKAKNNKVAHFLSVSGT